MKTLGFSGGLKVVMPFWTDGWISIYTFSFISIPSSLCIKRSHTLDENTLPFDIWEMFGNEVYNWCFIQGNPSDTYKRGGCKTTRCL